MRFAAHRFALMLLSGVVLAGCGTSSSPSLPPSGQLERVPGSPAGKVVLSPLGAQRIGIETAPARADGPEVVIPFSAVIYDPDGRTFAFANVGPVTYVEVPITVARVAGPSAYLTHGPRPGTKIVSVGAEELWGVQTGVLAQK